MSTGNTQPDGSGTFVWLRANTNGRLEMVGPAAHDAAAVGPPIRAGGVYHSANPAGTDGDILDLLLDALGRLKVNLDWTPTLQSDENLNDSDKSLVVPASTEWRVRWIWLEFTTTAVVGVRQIELEIQDDAADVVGKLVPATTQAASLTYTYLFSPSGPASEALRDGTQTHILSPDWYLPAGYTLRIYDNKAIDAAADDLNVQVMVEARSV